ncbi:chymotrypsin-like elastase family member 2A [Prinia subflava]|uniref:chymotrypsin-like elastase family member 2A n=1 Tax=Prinia subflava TaxID=208062 RepID=UPI002FE0D47F
MALLPVTPLSIRHLPRDFSAWGVVMGATDLTQPGPKAVVRHIQRLLVHQHYMAATARNDIALLELQQPVECSDYIQLGCVPDASLRVSELKSCYIAGWNLARGQFPTACVLRGRAGHPGDTDRPRTESARRTPAGPGLGAARAAGRSPRQHGAWNGRSCEVPSHPNSPCWP